MVTSLSYLPLLLILEDHNITSCPRHKANMAQISKYICIVVFHEILSFICVALLHGVLSNGAIPVSRASQCITIFVSAFCGCDLFLALHCSIAHTSSAYIARLYMQHHTTLPLRSQLLQL